MLENKQKWKYLPENWKVGGSIQHFSAFHEGMEAKLCQGLFETLKKCHKTSRNQSDIIKLASKQFFTLVSQKTVATEKS